MRLRPQVPSPPATAACRSSGDPWPAGVRSSGPRRSKSSAAEEIGRLACPACFERAGERLGGVIEHAQIASAGELLRRQMPRPRHTAQRALRQHDEGLHAVGESRGPLSLRELALELGDGGKADQIETERARVGAHRLAVERGEAGGDGRGRRLGAPGAGLGQRHSTSFRCLKTYEMPWRAKARQALSLNSIACCHSERS